MRRCLVSFIRREIKPTEANRPYFPDGQKLWSWKTLLVTLWRAATHIPGESAHTPLFSSWPPARQLCLSSNWRVLFGGCHWHGSPHWEFIKMEPTNNGLGFVFIRRHTGGSDIPSGKSKVWDQGHGFHSILSVGRHPPEESLEPFSSQQCPQGVFIQKLVSSYWIKSQTNK